MLRLVALIALAGCGRIGFDVASRPTDDGGGGGDSDGVVAVGHDDDGDGVPDAIDTCPYLAAPQTDGDGDGVGDACDPNPTVARDHIMLFSTMAAGDQPLMPYTGGGGGTWSQGDDAWILDGPVGTSFYGGATMPLTAGDVRVALSIDIVEVGTSAAQHQFAVSTVTALPNYFAEFNEMIGVYSVAQLTYYDGMNYSGMNDQALTNGVHPGPVTFVLTERIGTSTRLDLSWPGEPYVSEIDDAVYQGSQLLQLNVNNLRLQIRSLCIITSS